MAKANRAKWLGQAERKMAIRLQSIIKTEHNFQLRTHTHTEQKKIGCAQKENEK